MTIQYLIKSVCVTASTLQLTFKYKIVSLCCRVTAEFCSVAVCCNIVYIFTSINSLIKAKHTVNLVVSD